MRIYLIDTHTFVISYIFYILFYINNKFNKKLKYVCVRALFNRKTKKISKRKKIAQKNSRNKMREYIDVKQKKMTSISLIEALKLYITAHEGGQFVILLCTHVHIYTSTHKMYISRTLQNKIFDAINKT